MENGCEIRAWEWEWEWERTLPVYGAAGGASKREKGGEKEGGCIEGGGRRVK